MTDIMRAGENCWSLGKFERLSLLIDGDEYFKAFFNVARKAQRSIYILGWEVDGRLGLKKVRDLFPDDLRDYFVRLAEKKRGIRIHILSWKSSAYLLFDREKFARLRWKLEAPESVRYEERRHPYLYGTHHEKVAIVDESCAFMGGMDISRKRWDTCEHKLSHPLRQDSTGNAYHPIHDIQAVCSGPLVDELVSYFKGRRGRAEHPSLKKLDIWPEDMPLTLRNEEAGLSMTNVKKGLFQIEHLYEDAIRSAKSFIYIENQYFSHQGLIELLCQRLREPDGPEVVIILPMSYRGLFEKAVYENARNKAMAKLREADRFKRLLLLYPSISERKLSPFIVVHSKIMVVDNEFMTVGSANLNYRSMRVDSELNLSLESHGKERVKAFIRSNLFKLVTEHLNVGPREWESVFQKKGLVGGIRHFQGRTPRTLRNLEISQKRWEDDFLLLLTPFVDIKYSFPKLNLLVILFAMLFMGFVFHEVI